MTDPGEILRRPKKPTIKELHKQLSTHSLAIELASGRNYQAWSWHKTRYSEIWEELKLRYKERKPVAEATARARNERWRHYGAQGSLRWALSSVAMIEKLPTATLESKELAQKANGLLIQLLNSLSTKKDSD